MKNKKILVVEDSIFMSKLICETLLNAEFEIFCIDNGAECLESIKSFKPDLVLLDGVLTDMLGTEICKLIRDDPRNNLLPVIMLTGQEQVEERLTALENGADDYIMKPFNERELISRITNTLKRIDRNRYANPLTGLSGNVEIEAEINLRIANKDKFAVIYADLNNFKFYNDIYGFINGDKVILQLADVLINNTTEYKDVFLGHIGADEFIIVSPQQYINKICEKITEDFNSRLDEIYSKEDFKNDGVFAKNPEGVLTKYPLITISIVAITNETREFGSSFHMSEVLSDAKRKAKGITDRRFAKL